MTALTWLLLCAAAAPSPAPSAKVVLSPLLPPSKVSAKSGEETPCAACHVSSTWSDVKFDHDKTGFALKGRHAATSCKSCHPVDFKRAVPKGCAGCHQDVHTGELGAQCAACHDETRWASRFDADAHRRTGFPLVGGHANIPCEECHASSQGLRFTRDTVDCVGCHQADYARTSMTGVNHSRLGFATDCRACHQAWAFKPARYPGHDLCFSLSQGPHAGITCAGCHTSLAPVFSVGACNTSTASCTGCHEHTCAKSDPIHQRAQVPGYQCKDRKCYACHQFTVRGGP